MRQLPEGPDGTYTDEQKRRSIAYSFAHLASAIEPTEANKKLLQQLVDAIDDESE